MLKKSLVVALVLAAFAGSAAADIVCPDSSYAYASITLKTRVTIAPNGAGETFAGTGITIHVYLKNCNGAPLVGVPAQEIVIYNSGLCICPGGNIADAATDINGHTTFTGTIRGGGCVENLQVYADGVALLSQSGTLLGVQTNSPDHVPASPCAVDASDLSSLASKLGVPANYSICYDYNESGGPTIDASDLSFFASLLGAQCQ
jgi:hypothetical protein